MESGKNDEWHEYDDRHVWKGLTSAKVILFLSEAA